MSDLVLFNGAFLPEEEVRISPFNRGMMYGDGCFETYRSYQNRFLHFKDYFERLQNSLRYLSINSPFTQSELHQFSVELIQINELNETDAMIRLQIWRDGQRGYKTDSSACNWIMNCSELSPDSTPISLETVSIPVIPEKALSRKGKFSNGINYIKAAQETKADDALMITKDGFISETTISNVFWVKGKQVYTPSLECDLLPGVTRSIIAELLNAHQGKFEVDDIRNAEAVFCTNSVREIVPVYELDGVRFNTAHPVILQAKELFENYKSENLQE